MNSAIALFSCHLLSLRWKAHAEGKHYIDIDETDEIAAHILKDVHKKHEEKTAKPHKRVCGPSNSVALHSREALEQSTAQKHI